MEYIYIGTALENIHRLAKCKSRKEFFKRLKDEGIVCTTYTTFSKWEEEGTIRLKVLIDICNYVKLPFVYFLGIKGFKRYYHHYQTVNENWTPIVWDTKSFIEDCMKKCHYRKKEVMALTGMSTKMFQYLEKGDMNNLQNMSIEKFLGYVNDAGLHIANYIIDTNVPDLVEEEDFSFYYSQSYDNNNDVAAEANGSDMENAALRERIHQLEDDIIQLRQENLQLQKIIQKITK